MVTHFRRGFLCGAMALAFANAVQAQDWPHWRGPSYSGAVAAKGLPTEFGPVKNVRWKTAMPGSGASTPIVIGDRIFLTSIDQEREQLVAMCVRRSDGEVLWSKHAGSGYKPTPQGTNTARGARTRATYASPSAVSDGERVLFFFGNGDLVCYGLEGKQQWRRNIQEDYGNFAFNWTFSASPTLVDGVVYLPVLQRDEPIQRGRRARGGPQPGGAPKKAEPKQAVQAIDSFVLAINPVDGKTIYKHVRPSPAKVESLESYTSMIPYVGVSGRKEMLLVGGDVITGHDPATGKELWRWGTWNQGHRERFWRLVPTVVVGDGVALVCAPKRAPVYAIKLGGKGGLSEGALAWQSKGRPNPVSSDVPTPAFVDGHFYVLSDVQSALSKVRAKDGEVIWTTKMSKEHLWRSSPTVADGHVWCMNHNGVVAVVSMVDGKIVHQVAMAGEDDDLIRASVVVAHDDVLIRTNDTLFCVSANVGK
ncbi:MAG: outer membrane protein assembly factor BamB [Planctomycetota bacterium]|jgi:outer membrane protein assembly factor BamB